MTYSPPHWAGLLILVSQIQNNASLQWPTKRLSRVLTEDQGAGRAAANKQFFSPNSLLEGFSMQLRCLRLFRTLSPFVSLHMVVAVSAFLGLCLPLSSLVYVGVLFFGSDFGFHAGKFLILKKIVNRNAWTWNASSLDGGRLFPPWNPRLGWSFKA